MPDPGVVVDEPSRVHAVRRHERIDDGREVRRGEPEFPPALESVHDDSAHIGMASEHGRRRSDVALHQQLADPARRHASRGAGEVHVVDDLDREAVTRTELAQKLGGAGSPSAEPEVLPDEDRGDPKGSDEDVDDEVLSAAGASSSSNVSTRVASSPSSPRRSSLRSTVTTFSGQRSGRITASGLRSNVTATDRLPVAAAASSRRSITARWPAWTPSNLPIATALGPKSSGTSSGLRKTITRRPRPDARRRPGGACAATRCRRGAGPADMNR